MLCMYNGHITKTNGSVGHLDTTQTDLEVGETFMLYRLEN